jgi:hypothetical protein
MDFLLDEEGEGVEEEVDKEMKGIFITYLLELHKYVKIP